MNRRVKLLDELRKQFTEAHSESVKDEMCRTAEGRCDLCRACEGWKRSGYIPDWHQRRPVGMGGRNKGR